MESIYTLILSVCQLEHIFKNTFFTERLQTTASTSSSGMELHMLFPLAKGLKIKLILQ